MTASIQTEERAGRLLPHREKRGKILLLSCRENQEQVLLLQYRKKRGQVDCCHTERREGKYYCCHIEKTKGKCYCCHRERREGKYDCCLIADRPCNNAVCISGTDLLNSFKCDHTEVEIAKQTFCLNQSTRGSVERRLISRMPDHKVFDAVEGHVPAPRPAQQRHRGWYCDHHEHGRNVFNLRSCHHNDLKCHSVQTMA